MKKEKISTFLHGLFWICFGLMYIYIFSARNAEDFPFFRIEIIIVLGIIFIFVRRKNIKKFPIVLFVGSFIIRMIMVLCVRTQPESDFKLMYDAAQMLLQHDFSFNSGWYFQTWAYQIGFVLWEAFFLAIWNSLWCLKIVNCLLGAGINLLIYFISKEIMHEEVSSRYVALVYMIFPFSVLHITVLTNSHASAFFLFLGIYCLIRREKYKYKINAFIQAALCIALGNILRPDGLIILISIGVYIVYALLQAKKKCEIKRILGEAFIVFSIYFMIMGLASGIVKVSGISPHGLENRNPLWKFVVGTNYESKGGWNKADDEYVKGKVQEDTQTYEEVEIPLIRERLEDKKLVLCLIDEKVNQLWWQEALWRSFSAFERETYSGIIDWCVSINKAIWSFVLILMGIGIKNWCAKGKENIISLLIPFIIFATFMVYLMIEVQARYLYLAQIAVFIMASGGINFFQKMLKKVEKQREYIKNLK